MNERIRELEDQCWVKVPCDFDMNAGGLSTIRTVFDRKKFAELIIQKCVSQIAMIGISNFENDDVAWTVETSIDSIQEHFGIRRDNERTTS